MTASAYVNSFGDLAATFNAATRIGPVANGEALRGIALAATAAPTARTGCSACAG